MKNQTFMGGQVRSGDGHRPPPPRIVVMGVSGSGKTTVGALFAAELGMTFIDGDELHPPEHIAKMAAGTPLEDEDRLPWLTRVGEELAEAPQPGLVIACSALKKSYRQLIVQLAPGTFFLHVDGPEDLLITRLASRDGHFMPPGLLASQLAILEPLADDERGVRLDIEDPVGKIVQDAVPYLRQKLDFPAVVHGSGTVDERGQ